MASGRGRRTTPAARALGVWLLALGAACGQGVDAAHPVHPGHPMDMGAADDVPGGAVAPSDPKAGRWTPILADVVERWKRAASRHSGGRASPADVEVALHVRALGSGTELAALGADTPLVPASNMKLVTTAAALVLLGPHMEFLTPFEAGGPIEDGVLRGDLIVRAAGDPICALDGDARVEERLGDVARRLAAGGLRRVAGDLVLDEEMWLVL